MRIGPGVNHESCFHSSPSFLPRRFPELQNDVMFPDKSADCRITAAATLLHAERGFAALLAEIEQHQKSPMPVERWGRY
jgi:hypothetical protein